MNYEPILIVAGEPNSVFLEIFFKSLEKIKIKRPLILIVSLNLLKLQMKKLGYKKKIRVINKNDIDKQNLDNKYINLINVDYDTKNAFKKITSKSKNYIFKSFNVAFEILKSTQIKNLINGPISKKNLLDKKYLGMTEYISEKFLIKKNCMLIYNKELAVCPITTHLPINKVAKKINKKIITQKVTLINEFYKKKLGFTPNIAILGLNPHCESNENFNEDYEILPPVIKSLKKSGFKISGPYPADTIFLKTNRSKFNVIVGMYHDQVLTPMKTIYEYDAINITLGLPFTRISPDHGPNEKMLGKNISNPLSLIRAIEFLDKQN